MGKTLQTCTRGLGATLTDILYICNAKRSPFMSITLQAMIVDGDEWPTRKLLPWYHTDKVNIGWSVWKFDRTLADLGAYTTFGLFGFYNVTLFVHQNLNRGFQDTLLRNTSIALLACFAEVLLSSWSTASGALRKAVFPTP